jgi:peptidoglycan/xylan/chitin deacetylase (PgdA/CDA1 family)
MASPSILYLMYHELELSGRKLCHSEPGYTRYVLGERQFREQMEYMKAHEYQGLSVGQALTFPAGSNIAITFDDGSETDLLAAAPILREMGFGATFYITAGWLEQPGHLSRGQLGDLSGQGFEIGSHSMTHALLTDLDGAGLKREIADSKLHLEQILDRPVNHFSCPGGRYDRRAVAVARAAGYHSMATSRLHVNFSQTESFALGRVPILRGASIEDFAAICSGKALPRMRAQSKVRDTMKRLLGNSFYDRLRQIVLGSRSTR